MHADMHSVVHVEQHTAREIAMLAVSGLMVAVVLIVFAVDVVKHLRSKSHHHTTHDTM
jgi:hypothetical protein